MRKVFLVILFIGLLVVISGCTQQSSPKPTISSSPTKTIIETPVPSITTSPTASPLPIPTQSSLVSQRPTSTIPISTTSPITLDKDTATQKLIQAGCGYNLSWESVCIVFEDPNWVIQKEGCGGKCKINSVTNKTEIYDNPMCTGLLLSCQTDADCSNVSTTCATKYVCQSSACIAVFK